MTQRLSARSLLALSLGVTLLLGLLWWQGLGDIAQSLAAAGWGVLLVAAFHVLPLLLDAAGLAVVLDRRWRSPAALRARWVGESVNSLLPLAQLGGEFAKLRVLQHAGIGGAQAGAAVVATLTLAGATQAAFALLGLVLLAQLVAPQVLLAVVAGVGLFALLIALFYRQQRRDLFARLARRLSQAARGREWLDLTGGAQALDRALQALYGRARVLWASAGLHFAAWIVGTGEVWLALQVLGHPVSWTEALLLESLGQAIRGLAFAIPGALGVQEGGYLFLGPLVGIAPDMALALSLVKRARELILGFPGVIYWQLAETRALQLGAGTKT